jgi:hypothetical protein
MQEKQGRILALIAAVGLVFAGAMAQETQGQDPAGQQNAIPEQEDAVPEQEEGAVPEDAVEESSDGEPPAVDDSAVDPDRDDSDLDDQTYESDDDIFVPSEEIPADEPIPFPSDI